VDSHRSQGCERFTDDKNEPKLYFILHFADRKQIEIAKGFRGREIRKSIPANYNINPFYFHVEVFLKTNEVKRV